MCLFNQSFLIKSIIPVFCFSNIKDFLLQFILYSFIFNFNVQSPLLSASKF